jgi:hypothetical protein
MWFQDQQLPPPPPPRGPSHRAAWVAEIAVALLVVIAAVAVLITRGDGEAAGFPSPEPSQPQTTSTPRTTLDTQTEVVARLREILRVREQAFARNSQDLWIGVPRSSSRPPCRRSR